MSDWHRQIIDGNGVRLAVFAATSPRAEPTTDDDQVGNRRPTVLLVHGWPDTHHLWTHVAPILAEHFDVYAYDTRGYGESDRPGHVEAYRLDHLAADLRAVADAVSPDHPVHVVAHDWGSVQSWEAVTTPGIADRIASFVSVSGPNLDYLDEWFTERRRRPTPRSLRDLTAQQLCSLYARLFKIPGLSDVLVGVALSPRRWRWFVGRTEGVNRDQIVLGPTFRRDAVSGLRYYRANLSRRRRPPHPRPTSVPVLELVNTRDVALRPAIFVNTRRHAAKLWRRQTPTGHWLPYAHPDHLAQCAREFIELHEHGNAARPDTVGRARLVGGPTPVTGHLAVVTGAGSGIGRETAYTLAELGCEIVAADIDAAAADETARHCRAAGARATGYRVDVSDVGAVTDFAEQVKTTHGVADIVINNAGIGLGGDALEATDEQVDHLLDVNLRGVISGSRAFGRQMVDRGVGGHIVNVASAAAFTPQRGLGIYSASKAGVLLFSESLRAELAEHRIGVTAICPGIVDTNIVSTSPIAGLAPEAEAAEQERLDRLYRRRGFTPDKVARDIVRALVANRAVVPVTPEAKIGYRIYRFTPWVSRLGARRRIVRPPTSQGG